MSREAPDIKAKSFSVYERDGFLRVRFKPPLRHTQLKQILSNDYPPIDLVSAPKKVRTRAIVYDPQIFGNTMQEAIANCEGVHEERASKYGYELQARSALGEVAVSATRKHLTS